METKETAKSIIDAILSLSSNQSNQLNNKNVNTKNIDMLKKILYKFIKYDLDISWALLALDKYRIDSVGCYRLVEMVLNGLIQKIDVSWFMHPKLDFDQRAAIYFGLLAGVDVSIYANPKFNAGQMRIIRDALKHNVDVSIFANPKLSAEEMMNTVKKLL